MRRASGARGGGVLALVLADRLGNLVASAVNTGFKDVIGSWKIMAMSAPRTLRMTRWLDPARSITEPLRRRKRHAALGDTAAAMFHQTHQGQGRYRLCPNPDSPTMARVSPPVHMERQDCARLPTVRSEPTKRTVRSSTWTTRFSGSARLFAAINHLY